MATPWIFYSTLLDRYRDSNLLLNLCYDEVAPTNKKTKHRNIYPLSHSFINDNNKQGIIMPCDRFHIADVIIRKLRNYDDQYYKKVLCEWIHIIKLEQIMPHSIFVLITQYSDLIHDMQRHMQSITIMPINIQRVLDKTSLAFYDTCEECICATRNVIIMNAHLNKCDIYKILCIAYMYDRKICPWAPIHYNICDTQMIFKLRT